MTRVIILNMLASQIIIGVDVSVFVSGTTHISNNSETTKERQKQLP